MTAVAAEHPRRGSARGAARFVFLTFVVVAVLTVVSARPAAATGCSDPIGADEIRVSIVVDSDMTGVSSECLVVPAGTTGSQLLARRAAALGRFAPRYAQSGLLCAIDGYPAAPACGDRRAGGFAYWAYFNGTSGSWSYGSYNPFIRHLSDGDVEGWRFVGGGGDAGDPPPRIMPPRLGPAVRATAPAAPVGGEPSNGPAVGPTPGAPLASGVDPGDSNASSSGADPSGSSTSTSVVVASGAEELSDALPASSSNSGSNGVMWLMLGGVLVIVGSLAVGAVVRARSTR